MKAKTCEDCDFYDPVEPTCGIGETWPRLTPEDGCLEHKERTTNEKLGGNPVDIRCPSCRSTIDYKEG